MASRQPELPGRLESVSGGTNLQAHESWPIEYRERQGTNAHLLDGRAHRRRLR